MKKSLKLALIASSIAVLSACGGGGSDVVVIDQPHAFLSVDNLNYGNGVVAVRHQTSHQHLARSLMPATTTT